MKKHFYFVFLTIVAVILLAGHGMLKVASGYVKMRKFDLETRRMEALDNVCAYLGNGVDLAFVVDGKTYKCSQMYIITRPSVEKEKAL